MLLEIVIAVGIWGFIKLLEIGIANAANQLHRIGQTEQTRRVQGVALRAEVAVVINGHGGEVGYLQNTAAPRVIQIDIAKALATGVRLRRGPIRIRPKTQFVLATEQVKWSLHFQGQIAIAGFIIARPGQVHHRRLGRKPDPFLPTRHHRFI